MSVPCLSLSIRSGCCLEIKTWEASSSGSTRLIAQEPRSRTSADGSSLARATQSEPTQPSAIHLCSGCSPRTSLWKSRRVSSERRTALESARFEFSDFFLESLSGNRLLAWWGRETIRRFEADLSVV